MKAYKLALTANNEAIAEFHFYRDAYRTMQISDNEYLAAKAKYDAAMAEFDNAYALASKER